MILIAFLIIAWSIKINLIDKLKEEYQSGLQQDELYHKNLLDRGKKLSVEELLLNKAIDEWDKITLLEEIHGYNAKEIDELLKTAGRAERKVKLGKIKRKISQKAQQLYGNIPVDDKRTPLSDEIKLFVWNRDSGKCVKCGSKENLEFDHIIPVSKGGSSTARNIQLLCEQCNRSKKDSVA